MKTLERVYLEPGLLDGREGVSIEMAAPEEMSPEWPQAILPAGCGPPGTYVLDKQQPSARTQDAPDFVQCGLLIRDRAQDERRDHGVEATVRERQLLSPSRRDLDGDTGVCKLLFKPPAHEGIGLGDGYPIYITVVRQVSAGAATDLEHGATGPGEQPPPAPAHPPPLHGSANGVVERREHRMSVFVVVAGSPHKLSIQSLPHWESLRH